MTTNNFTYQKHTNSLNCYKYNDWQLYNKSKLYYYDTELDTHIPYNTHYILLDEFNTKIIDNNNNISQTSLITFNPKISIDLYHQKYCYLDVNNNKWIYNTKKTINNIENKNTYKNIFSFITNLFN